MPSATLASLTADVMSITKRADLVGATQLAIKNALIKAHSRDFFLQDLFETNFQFNVAAPVYQLDYKTLIPRFRKMKYLTYVDPITLEFVEELEGIPLEKFLDSYGYIKTNVYYLAGTQIQIRTSGSQQIFGLGCYLYPDTTLVSPSWIADEIPAAIIYEACRSLFKTMGFDEQSAAMKELVAEAYQQITVAGIPTVGE